MIEYTLLVLVSFVGITEALFFSVNALEKDANFSFQTFFPCCLGTSKAFERL